MKQWQWVLVVPVLLMSVSASVQAQGGTRPDPQRLEAIWAATENRLNRQLDIWFEDGEFPITIQLLRFQSVDAPANYDTWTNLGWMLENIEEQSEALIVYKTFLNNNPTDPDRALPLATFYFRKRQFDDVVAVFRPGISEKAHPNNFRMLAHAYERSSRLERSKQVWDRYLKLHPDDGAGINNRNRVIRKIEEQKT